MTNLFLNEKVVQKKKEATGADFYKSSESRNKFLTRTDQAVDFNKQLKREGIF